MSQSNRTKENMVTITEIDDTSYESAKIRELGNQYFKEQKFEDAASCYLKCIKLKGNNKDELLTAHKNLAAVYLKLEKYEDALKSASQAIQLCPNDVKALFRRCQAYAALERYSEAIKDGLLVKHLEPNNKAITELLRNVNERQQAKIKEMSTINNKVESMFKLMVDESAEMNKRETAVENLMVLARDECGAQLISTEGGFSKLRTLIEKNFGKHDNLVQSAVRTISELCKKSPERCITMLKCFDGIMYLLNGLSMCKSELLITSIQYTIQTMINSFSGYDMKTGKKSDEKLLKTYQTQVDLIMSSLVDCCNRRVMTGLSRDAILELIMKNVDYEVLNWGTTLVKMKKLENLLDVAGELEDIHYECSMEITCNTRPHVSLALERIYNCLDCDKTREDYRNQVIEFIDDKLRGPDVENKVRSAAVITTLLYGPVEVGNHCLSKPGIVEMMLVMAGCDDDEVQQRVAAEAIIAAASKKDKCTSIVSMGTNILKKLYQSPNEGIKVRALVGLCKIGSVGGTDAAFKPFSDGSVHKLTSACKKFITSSTRSRDIRKWAVEGFAYLSLDADVKEELVDDPLVINAMIDLAKSGDQSALYGVITTLVNLTNSYEKNEVLPEMLELAKFAKQHVPEEHIKDKKEYVDKRVKKLAKMNIAVALVALSKTESRSARELICRVFNAICEFKEFRGSVVSAGGAKALLNMALENSTGAGKLQAAQALARIGITMNPETAFPGQRSAEVVRPIMELLRVECSALQNFEALMALTNLAQVSESVSNRIIKDGGFPKIENYMYEDHTMLRRAATQCVTNLITKEPIVKLFEGENDRVKLLTILCEEDDLDTAKAAAGALAMLTGVSKKACKKIFEAKRWFEILLMITSSKDADLRHRGVMIVRNMILSDKETAEKVVETLIFQVLMAIVRPEVDDIPDNVKKLAQEALNKAKEWKLIKPSGEAAEGSDDEPD